MKNNIEFAHYTGEMLYKLFYNAGKKGAYNAYIRGKRCKTEDDFFREASAAFQFPRYFGENWAAFDECITDLDWLQFDSLFIILDDYDCVFDGDPIMQKLLLRHIDYFVSEWTSQGVQIYVILNYSV